MAVTANQLIYRADDCKAGIPVAASTTLYQGTMCFLSATGYLDDDTASGVNLFAGINIKYIDNSSGSAGDVSAEVWTDGVFKLTGSGFSQASVGQKVYATDNATLTLDPATANSVYVGVIREYVSSTVVWVEIEPEGLPAGRNLVLYDGGTNKPGVITLYEADGTPQYLWVDADKLRIHTAFPTTAASDGAVVGTQT